MKTIKLLIMVVAISAALSFGSPAAVRASSVVETPPAVVFVQDKNNSMLLSHDFKYDNGMLVPVGTNNVDEGFSAQIP